MSDTPESIRGVAKDLYWADANLSEVRAAMEALERYAELLERSAAKVPKSEWELMVDENVSLKARVAELEERNANLKDPIWWQGYWDEQR
jgi:cell division protein FtsB